MQKGNYSQCSEMRLCRWCDHWTGIIIIIILL